jgi:hypothetical protein
MKMSEDNRNNQLGDWDNQYGAERLEPIKDELQKNLSDFKAAKKKAESDIREYFRSQKELWRLVPNLALEANFHGGWSPFLDHAYREGYLFTFEHYGIYIDLETGELVDRDTVCGSHDPDEPCEIDDAYIGTLAYDIGKGYCDAEKIISELKQQTSRSHQKDKYTSEEYHLEREREEAEAREKVRKEYGIETVYTRRSQGGDEEKRRPSLDDMFRNTDYPDVKNIDLERINPDDYELGLDNDDSRPKHDDWA